MDHSRCEIEQVLIVKRGTINISKYVYNYLSTKPATLILRSLVQSNFDSSNVSFSNPSESSKMAVGPEFSAIYFMHF